MGADPEVVTAPEPADTGTLGLLLEEPPSLDAPALDVGLAADPGAAVVRSARRRADEANLSALARFATGVWGHSLTGDACLEY